MAQVVTRLSLTFRHRWLGLAFAALVAIPADLMGMNFSDKASDRLARVTLWLMGPKITAS